MRMSALWPHRAIARMRHKWYVMYSEQCPDWQEIHQGLLFITITIIIIILIIKRRELTQHRTSGLKLQGTVISAFP